MRILGRGNKSKYGNLPAWEKIRKPLAGEAGCRNFRLRRAGYGNLPVRPAGGILLWSIRGILSSVMRLEMLRIFHFDACGI